MDYFGVGSETLATPMHQSYISYIWEDYYYCWEIYSTLRNYLTENYGVDTMLLLKMIEARGLELEKTLNLIAYIHSGFLSVVIEDMRLKAERDKAQRK